MAMIGYHFQSICEEHYHRSGKIHAYVINGVIERLYNPPVNITKGVFVPPLLAMPDIFKSNSPTNSYRKYYKHGKRFDKRGVLMHRWTNRMKPSWIE